MRWHPVTFRKISVLVFLIFVLPIFLTTCGSGGGGGNPVSSSNSGIGADGGTITSGDVKAKVVIPAGALTEATDITVEIASGTQPGNIGAAYEFGPSGISFNQPVTITISYDEGNLAGANEADLKLGKVVNNQWQAIDSSSVDTAANTVTAT
ncbi:TPA: hypothetical protein HA234_06385, partial [Candidatus Woesearchaeota archaeon]|nr:hypothetical protein [Candidatus Woesearchaeota archaeon]